MAHSVQIVIACEDPSRLAEFWAETLGYIVQPPPSGFETWDEFAEAMGIPEDTRKNISAVVDPEEVGPRILFERYFGGEPNQRVHIDVNVLAGGEVELTDEQRRARLSEERARLEGLGAKFKREASGMAGEFWIEMFDPEGNWFCVQ